MQESKPLLFVQFKAYNPIETAIQAAEKLYDLVGEGFQLHFVLPSTYIPDFAKQFEKKEVKCGAEMMLDLSSQSFTGTVAIPLLLKMQASYVLIGSKQERECCPSTTDFTAEANAALSNQITPVICFGESFDEFQEKKSKEVLKQQLSPYFESFSTEQMGKALFLYEAAWLAHYSLEANDLIQQAYETLKEVVSELLDAKKMVALRLVFTLPAYSPSLRQAMHLLPIAGFSLGALYAKAAELPFI